MNAKKHRQKKMAYHTISSFFARAQQEPHQANTMVRKARTLAQKYRIKLSQKRLFCKHCYTYFIHGQNCRVRTQQHKLVYYCYTCKRFTRIPLPAQAPERQ
ncbi:MAG: hypothetical protein ACMXYC_05170 [Candidatus Woesearchaeota archaeon]